MKPRLTLVTVQRLETAAAVIDDAIHDGVICLAERRAIREAISDALDQSRLTHNVHRLTDALECGIETPSYRSDLGLRAGYDIDVAA